LPILSESTLLQAYEPPGLPAIAEPTSGNTPAEGAADGPEPFAAAVDATATTQQQPLTEPETAPVEVAAEAAVVEPAQVAAEPVIDADPAVTESEPASTPPDVQTATVNPTDAALPVAEEPEAAAEEAMQPSPPPRPKYTVWSSGPSSDSTHFGPKED
jgi:hypothetical protein